MVVGVPGGVGTGATTHTDPTSILNILIRPTPAPATDAGMVTMAMVTDIATRLPVITAITAARTTKMTMKVLCAMFWPNTQFPGTAMTRLPSVVSSLKTAITKHRRYPLERSAADSPAA